MRSRKTGFSIQKNQFDKKTSTIIKDTLSNDQLEELRKHYFKRLKSYLVTNVGKEDIKELKQFLINKLHDEVTITEFWNMHIDSLRIAGRDGGARVYENSLNGIKTAINLDLPFSKINYKVILLLEESLFKRGMTINGIGVYMRSFRAICNKAIDVDVIGNDWYPFRKYKIKKAKTTPKVLTIEELRTYFQLDLQPNNKLYPSWQIGKLIFMLRGINLKDLILLSSNNVNGNRIIYKRSKTGKIYSVRLTDEIQTILSSFVSGDTLLGVFKSYDLKDGQQFVLDYIQRRKVINKHLNLIGKLINSSIEISTYVFRYSYANVAKQLGYSKDLIAEALGHEYGNSITGIYLEQFDMEIVDEMNDDIITTMKCHS
jgi:integrase